MKEILTDAQMKACDSYTIEQIGVPSAVLMERAAYAVSEEVIRFADKAGRPKITVICGSGNNGGDGYACARILSLKGYEAEIFEAGNLKHMTEETARQRGICQKLSIPFQDGDMPDLKYTGVIVDALFGIGLARDVSGRYADIINAVNDSGAPVIAVDIASGISANTGKVCGCAVKADATVTMQRIKPGHILYPGTLYSGKLICADIGVVVPETGSGTQAYSLERDDLPRMLPKRDPSGNKGTFGKVLIVAGSRNSQPARSCFAFSEECLTFSPPRSSGLFPHQEEAEIWLLSPPPSTSLMFFRSQHGLCRLYPPVFSAFHLKLQLFFRI